MEVRRRAERIGCKVILEVEGTRGRLPSWFEDSWEGVRWGEEETEESRRDGNGFSEEPRFEEEGKVVELLEEVRKGVEALD